jgi:putative heme-binding domain-containing protein
LLLSISLACPSLLPGVARAEHGLRLPAAFEITQVADGALANDIYCLTLDPRGRVVVSGRGYVRLLVADGRGRAVRALDFAAAPADGAMGLFWEGDTLYCVGGGGLWRYREAGGAGRTRRPELLVKLRTGGEHDAHAVSRGPDGWLYVLCGNSTGLPRGLPLLPTSPVHDKETVAGYLMRLPPDFSGYEIVAHGLRNAYGLDFNGDGEPFTFDSDNERCVALPWYEPTRCYHLADGAFCGWRSPQRGAFWRLPPYCLDVVAPAATLGRGSPTGVVCYRHTQFPARYRGGLFLLDWTFGRIHFLRLKRSGSSYTGTPEVFLRSVGDNGFAPTAAAVHPVTGDLYVAIGGRGTRGAVYRIRYPAGLVGVKPEEVARLQPPRRSLDWAPGSGARLLKQAAGDDLHARRRALTMLRRHRPHFGTGQIEDAIRANAGHPNRGLRQAAAGLLACLDEKEQRRVGKLLKSPLGRTARGLARPGFEAAGLLADPALPASVRLDAVRLMQRALGGLTAKDARGTVWEGYTRRSPGPPLPDTVRSALRAALPSGQADLDRELTRTLALVDDADPRTLAKVADFLTPRSDPVEDVHYLAVLARLPGPRTAALTRRTAAALLTLDRKLEQRRIQRDTNWPLRVAELHAGLARRDPALNAALLAHADFGRADHALFAGCPGFDRRRAAELFLARLAKEPEFAWNAELVRLLGELPPEKGLPALRGLWGEYGLDEEIVLALARHPRPADRGRFVTGLGAVRVAVVLAGLGALEKIPRKPSDKEATRDESLALVRALRQAPKGKEGAGLRERLERRLQVVTGRTEAGPDAWTRWLRATYPALAARLADADGVDVAAWEKRLAGIDWAAGDAGRGKVVYTKASCATCHSGGQALGPDLRGVAGRFSRADLFTAILRPSKDVSPRYRTTLITTTTGKLYQGLVVYEAVDGVLLQTGPGTTVRVGGGQISGRRVTATSLMPAGLLDRLSDREISDLYAYLKTLGTGRKDG